MLEGIFKPKT